MDVETEIQRISVICPRSYNSFMIQLRSEHNLFQSSALPNYAIYITQKKKLTDFNNPYWPRQVTICTRKLLKHSLLTVSVDDILHKLSNWVWIWHIAACRLLLRWEVLYCLVTDGLPDAHSEKQLGLFGMRLDKTGAKEASEINPTPICQHSS